jgi:MarR family 2-MHQ and catechol resistance regulon transcriptional repressor
MKRPAPIPETQERALRTYTYMMRATSAVTDKMHKHLALDNLTLSQFAVLEALYHLGPLCQKEIGEKILKTSGNMTLVIDNLEKRDLAIREKDQEDRRRTSVRLTDKGLKLIDRVFSRHSEIAETVFSVMTSDELNAMGKLLKKIGKAR